jgi:hypothetical protein
MHTLISATPLAGNCIPRPNLTPSEAAHKQRVHFYYASEPF